MRTARLLSALAVVASVGYWIAFRRGALPLLPGLFAALMAAAALGLAAEAVAAAFDWARRRSGPGRAGARLLFAGGLLVAIGGGTVNWLFSLQGYVILVEGETARLGAGGQLEGFEAGPLGNPKELEVDLALARVELQASGGGTFDPMSLLETRRAGGEIVPQTIGAGRIGDVGPLRLRQGAFGYAPHLVVLQGERAAFDRVVPFVTRRDGRLGTSFAGEIELENEGLQISGEVVLDSLDERLQGHPALHIVVRKGETLLGEGLLLPGQFAELEEEYRVGFAGLEKWSEIDVARRNYPVPMLAGFAVALAGALLWPLAAWRGW